MIVLRDYQQEAVDEIRTALAKYRRVLFQLPTGGGKCLGKDTPILMYDGTTKKVQDVKVGDFLMGDDSHPRRVESVCSGKEEMFRITPIKGDSFECNRSHILSLRYTDAKHGFAKRDISVNDYIKLSGQEKHLLKLYRACVDFDEKELPIDPYVLGLWLAEGAKTGANPTFTINKDDKEVIDYLLSLGGKILADDKRGKNCHNISLAGITNPNGRRKNSCIYRDEFKRCLFGSYYNIGIPYEYKVNSYSNRMQLLAGILDGDGSTDNSKCGFEVTTKYRKLADDILYLCRSLGFGAYCHVKKVDLSKIKGCVSKETREYFRITISGFCEKIPLKIKRKRSVPRKMNKNVLNVGFSIESLGIGDYYGFEISGNNRRFLLGDFTVTHNTCCFSYMAYSSQKYKRKVLIMSDRSEILMQNGGSLERMGLEVQYVNPKNKDIPTSNCVCSMSQTLRRRLEKEEWRTWIRNVDFCIVDECHVSTHDFIYDYLSDKCFVLGVTATPARNGKQRQLGEIFRAMVIGVSVKTLIDKGYLSQAKHYSIAAPKLDVKIDSSTGDYNSKDLSKRFESRTRYKGTVSEYIRLAKGQKAICFCVSSRQCIELTKEFNDNGIKAKYILSGEFNEDSVYSGDRDAIIKEFKDGLFDVLVNVNCLTAGFDCPEVQCVILDFATVSIARYRQAIGRGARVTENKKEFTILDCGDNWRRLGMYDSETEWCLWHSVSSGGLPQLKDCDTKKKDINGKFGCGGRVPSQMKVCPICGYVFPTEHDEYVLHLEEVLDNNPNTNISFAVSKRIEGWSVPRILICVCLANTERMKKAFKEAYLAITPGKTDKEADRYFHVFMKQFGDRIKAKKE